jgi:hypothetical protein
MEQNLNMQRQIAGSNASFINQLPIQKEKLSGDVYLFNNMLEVKLTFNNEEVHQLMANYNLLDNKLEIRHNEQIKVVPIHFIDHLTVMSTKYINGSEYLYEEKPIKSLVKVLQEGEDLILVEMVELEFIKANYNVQLDAGYNYDRYVKKPMILMGEKDKNLKEVKGGKNKIFKLFEEQQELIKQYAKEHNLNPKESKDLAKLIEYADQI